MKINGDTIELRTDNKAKHFFWTPHKILDWAQHIAVRFVFPCSCSLSLSLSFDYVGFFLSLVVILQRHRVLVAFRFYDKAAAKMIESDFDCIEHNSTIKPLIQSIKYGSTPDIRFSPSLSCPSSVVQSSRPAEIWFFFCGFSKHTHIHKNAI